MEELLLVRRGTPAAVDVELDPVARGIRRGPAQRTEESSLKVGYTRDLIVKDRCAFGDDTIGLAEPSTALTAKDAAPRGRCRSRRGFAKRTAILTAKDVEAWGCRRDRR